MRNPNWEVWEFGNPQALASYVCDEANESFPVATVTPTEAEVRAGRLETIKAIYRFLAEQKIWYALDKYQPEQGKQDIRSPSNIAKTKEGTCLDLALLFAGLCLSRRLCPIVVVVEESAFKHAFVLVALDQGLVEYVPPEILRDGRPCMDTQRVRELVTGSDPMYLALECTGFVGHLPGGGAPERPPLDFQAATEQGLQALVEKNLIFALDIVSARYGPQPVPGRWDTEGRPAWPSLERRWAIWEEKRRSRIFLDQKIHFSPEKLVNAPAAPLLAELVNQRAWHLRIGDSIEKAITAAAEHSDVSRTLARIDLKAPYTVICERLSKALASWPNEAPGSSDRTSSNAKLGGKPFSGDLRRALEQLKREMEECRFERCLLVAGDLGAGKTHLVTSAKPVFRRKVLWLWLEDEDEGATLREKVERIVFGITGYPWSNLEEFVSYLADLDNHPDRPTLLVILDDFDLWAARRESAPQEVRRLIHDTLRCNTPHWVLLAHHAKFWRVSRGSEWKELAWPAPLREGEIRLHEDQPRIGDWLDLDVINQRDRLGIAVIQKFHTHGEEIEAEIPRGSAAEKAASNPLVAWTFLDCHLDVASLLNLNFIGFVKHFWESRSARLVPAICPDLVDQAVRSAAYLMAGGLRADGEVSTLGFEPPRSKLVDEIAALAKEQLGSERADPQEWGKALDALEGAGFCREVGRPNAIFGQVTFLELRLIFFWCWKAATSLRATLAGRNDLDLASLLPSGTDEDILEGVVEFFLLLADESKASESIALWERAAGSAIASAAWLAAAKGSAAIQVAAAGRIATLRPAGTDRRTLFAFLYFLGEARLEILPPIRRISALQPIWDTIRGSDSVSYCLYVLDKCFDRATNLPELSAAVSALTGVERLGATERVGEIVTFAAVRVCKHDFLALARWLLSYAQNDIQRIKKEPDPPAKETERIDGKYFLRDWIFFIGLNAVANLSSDEIRTAELFRVLRKIGWYGAGTRIKPDLVTQAMEVQANSVLGFRYDSSRGEAKEAYEDLVDELVQSSNARDRRLGFFLIRHTVRAGGHMGLHVPRTFEQALLRLFLDKNPAICRLVDSFYDDFKVNLSKFSEIERQRSAFHVRSERRPVQPIPERRRERNRTPAGSGRKLDG